MLIKPKKDKDYWRNAALHICISGIEPSCRLSELERYVNIDDEITKKYLSICV